MASWAAPAEGSRWIVLWAQCSQSNWDPYCGGKFTFEMLLGPLPRVAGSGTRRRLGRYLNDLDWQRWKALRNDIVSRADQPPPSFLAQLPPSLLGTYLSNFKPLDRVVSALDIWFPYLIEQDVVRWASFIQELLDRAIEAFTAEVRQPGARPF